MAALSSGNIAGAMVTPPQSVLLKEKGFRELVGIQQLKEMNLRFVENGVITRRAYAEKNPDIVKRVLKAVSEAMKKIHDDKELAMKVLGKYTKITEQKLLDESYRYAIDVFAKDVRVPPDGLQLMVDQLVASKMIDPSAAQKTPLSAYYNNRYVEELDKEGFFKKLKSAEFSSMVTTSYARHYGHRSTPLSADPARPTAPVNSSRGRTPFLATR